MTTTLITGTTRGIGNKLCKHFLNKNHKVISIARGDININNPNLIHLKCDITNPIGLNEIAQLIMGMQINNCILNAGNYNNSFFHKMNYNDWFNTINVNLLSVHTVLNPVLNNMRKHNSGNILFMSSIAGKIGILGASNYACSKSALYGLTKSLALENANKNILINSISPGYINEGMGERVNKLKICEKIPLNRFGETEDIVRLCDYMLENNKYITGSNININGGMF